MEEILINFINPSAISSMPKLPPRVAYCIEFFVREARENKETLTKEKLAHDLKNWCHIELNQLEIEINDHPPLCENEKYIPLEILKNYLKREKREWDVYFDGTDCTEKTGDPKLADFVTKIVEFQKWWVQMIPSDNLPDPNLENAKLLMFNATLSGKAFNWFNDHREKIGFLNWEDALEQLTCHFSQNRSKLIDQLIKNQMGKESSEENVKSSAHTEQTPLNEKKKALEMTETQTNLDLGSTEPRPPKLLHTSSQMGKPASEENVKSSVQYEPIPVHEKNEIIDRTETKTDLGSKEPRPPKLFHKTQNDLKPETLNPVGITSEGGHPLNNNPCLYPDKLGGQSQNTSEMSLFEINMPLTQSINMGQVPVQKLGDPGGHQMAQKSSHQTTSGARWNWDPGIIPIIIRTQRGTKFCNRRVWDPGISAEHTETRWNLRIAIN